MIPWCRHLPASISPSSEALLIAYPRARTRALDGAQPGPFERLDVSGTVVGGSTVWVLGGVPMDGRAYFRASVPDATGYRVQVLSFDWTGGGGGGMSQGEAQRKSSHGAQ